MVGAEGVGLDLLHQLPNHLFQFINKLLCVIFAALNFAQFLLPLPGQLGALEQVVAYEADELNACVGGYERLALFSNIVALKQGFDDGGAGGGASDAVLFQAVSMARRRVASV